MTETAFRLTSLALAVTYMTIRTVYERRLGRPAKLSQLKEAEPRDRLELVIVSFGTMPMWVYFLTTWLDFARMGLPDEARWAGLALTVAGIAVFVWTHSALAGNWSPFVERPRAGSLVTSGPYRWVRHPMYSSFFVYNAGMWLLTSNWLAGAPAFIAFTWMYFDRVGREERVMLDAFGPEHTVYAEKTGRVVPFLGRRAADAQPGTRAE